MRTLFAQGTPGAGAGIGAGGPPRPSYSALIRLRQLLSRSPSGALAGIGDPGSFAPTGWGLLEPVEEQEGTQGFAEGGWGLLERVPQSTMPVRQWSTALFGNAPVPQPVPLVQAPAPEGRPLGSFAPTGWGLLDRAEEEEGTQGFAEGGWGLLDRIPERAVPEPQSSPVLFGNPMRTVPLFMGQAPSTTAPEPPPGEPLVVPPPTERPDRRPRPVPVEYQPARFERLLLRLCSIMRAFKAQGVAADVQSEVFWSYVRHFRQPEDLTLAAFREVCPDAAAPPKPTRPPRELKPPARAGFHGKTRIGMAEARELLAALDEVLRPLSPEEAASDIADEECLRELASGSFPIVEDLRARLAEFVAAGGADATFEISHGETVVTGKAVECAVALGRAGALRTALTAGTAAAGVGIALLLLL
jgi:hypothetical protein